MAEASPITVHLGFDAEGFEKAAREYLDGLVTQYVTVDGKASSRRKSAESVIDGLEEAIQRMRIDEALKVSLVARLDELRGLLK